MASRRRFREVELFTAPEVVRGKNDASKESDLYSLGKIGFELLSDEPLRQEIVAVQN